MGRLYNTFRITFLEKGCTKIKIVLYKKVVRPIMLHGSKSWTITNKNKSRMIAMEIIFLRKIEGITRRDRIK